MILSDLQTEANFPLLASATVLLDRQLRKGNYKRILLSARDCYLQAHLWRQMFPSTPYEICYWMTSRWARIKAGAAYLDYCRELFQGKVLVFDLVGTGESLRALFERINCSPDYLLLQSDPRKGAPRILDGPGDVEGLNCAPHPMIVEVNCDHEPVCTNPQGIDWWKYFADIGGICFMAACKKPEFSEYIDSPEERLLRIMKRAEKDILDHDHLLHPFHLMRRNEDWQ